MKIEEGKTVSIGSVGKVKITRIINEGEPDDRLFLRLICQIMEPVFHKWVVWRAIGERVEGDIQVDSFYDGAYFHTEKEAKEFLEGPKAW